AGTAAVRAAGAATGRALRRAGVNVDLAPVADVARPGAALARERRTFGSDPQRVGALAGAFVRGLRAGGVAATAKHFPGMGAAPVNTDDAVVRIDASADELRARDEPPFRAAIAAGAELVMLANAVYPALDPDRPASLSRAIATGELRGRLGFRGVTITDDLEAGALAPFGGPARVAELGVRAGVDLLLFAGSYAATERAAAGLERAVAAGRLTRDDLAEGARRVLALRARLAR
ncbi:MAG: beta-N-acetylhexosaminidase, partial [Solirubrobacteraceae bacterium]|nr:beta-N-acetylhexosaminidase [Solirubrobacteraceae bacterium]